jgi:hypothetical protein
MKIILRILLICMIVSISVSGFSACTSDLAGPTNEYVKPVMAHVSRVEDYKSIDDIIKDSPIIVCGVVASKNKDFMDGEMSYALTEFRIETTIRGELPEKIDIFQIYAYEDPYLQEGSRMVLFLTPYSSRLAQGVYRLKGLFQGQYKIASDKVTKTNDNKITGYEIVSNIETLTSKALSLGYAPLRLPNSTVQK